MADNDDPAIGDTTRPRARWSWRNWAHRPLHGGQAGPPQTRRRRRWARWPAFALAGLLALGLVFLVVPIPFVTSLLGSYVRDLVAGQMSCPGKPPEVTVRGGALLPQLLHRRLAEIELTLPDLTVSGVKHAAFTATLHNVSQPEPNVTKVGSMDAAITIGFANLPDPPAGQPVPKYGRADDGSLAIDVTVSPDAAKNVRTKLFLKMDINGHTITSTPQRLTIFGRTLPAEQVGSMTGGVRKQQLPSLPAGLNYQSITPGNDGLHVALAGVSTTPLNQLPTDFAGQTVSYSSRAGLLGISTAFAIKPIINIPLTIFVEPKLAGGAMTMEPRSVEIFGANRPPSDLIAKLVLSQINDEDLTRELPALPSGIRYRSVKVDSGGIKVVVSGVTVQPFSSLPQPKGATTTYGADNGLLTVTTVGSAGRTMPVTVYATPTIKENKLEITPRKIAMFDTLFPAADVFAELKPSNTAYALQALPTNLHYKDVQVVPDGLRLRLTGKDVILGKDLLGGGC